MVRRGALILLLHRLTNLNQRKEDVTCTNETNLTDLIEFRFELWQRYGDSSCLE